MHTETFRTTTQRIDASVRSAMVAAIDHRRDERGEGVISTALAVLIISFLGVAAYALFRTLLNDSGNAARNQIQNYGGN
ncbi:MAG: hypothetical protein AB7N61_15380 [Acidimicrobiia bacterium]